MQTTSGTKINVLKEFNTVRISKTSASTSTSISQAKALIQAIVDEEVARLANTVTTVLQSSQINGSEGVKAIIGRGGSTIQGIQKTCGPALDINANVTDGTVTISGPRDVVDQATKLCKQAVFGESQQSVKLGSRLAMNIVLGKEYKSIQQLQTSTGAKLDMDKDKFVLKISGSSKAVDAAHQAVNQLLERCRGTTMEIPPANVGAVYGKAGSTIRNIQDRTGAFVEVVDAGTAGGGMAKCTIMGEPAAVEQARLLVVKAMSNEIELKPGQVMETIALGSAVSAVIGRGGSKIKELESTCQVELNVNSETNECRIVGKEANVSKAKEAVEAIIQPILAAEEAERQATIAAESGDSAWQAYEIPPDEAAW